MKFLKAVLLGPALAASLAATIPGEPYLSLNLLAGDPRQRQVPAHATKAVPGPRSVARFGLPERLAYAGTHTGFQHLDGKWLVLDSLACEILLMDGRGNVERWLPLTGETAPEGCEKLRHPTGLAVRPEGFGPWRAVLVDNIMYKVYEVDGKGGVRVLPGSEGIRSPYDAVIGVDEAVYVTTQFPARIYRIQDGKADVFAGGPERYDQKNGRIFPDGKGLEAGFSALYAITQDRQTGHLYVVDYCSGPVIRQVTMQGDVLTLAGARLFGEFEPSLEGRRLPKGPARMNGIPCFGSLGGLTVREGRLYIADREFHAIQELDLVSGELKTLAGHPSEKCFRPGPVRAGRPLPPADCAGLLRPNHLAFDDQGHALVAMGTPPVSFEQDPIGACIAELAPTWRDEELFGEDPKGMCIIL